MASAWGKIQPVSDTKNFAEITAEELVKSLQEKEFQQFAEKCAENYEQSEQLVPSEVHDTDSDAVIAQLLQNQFNKEYDRILKKTEEKFNGQSKVGISYANYRVSCAADLDERNSNIDDENQDVDRFVSIEKEYASIPKCGYKKSSEGSEIVTKHDILISSRINACRVLEFPPGISTGDTGGFDVKLNNKVFNSLRAHSHAHCAREKAKARPHNK